jgi:hypothetical protein
MANARTTELINKRTRLLEELSSLTKVLHGSWIERYSVCARKGCRCHQGERHGPRYYVVVNEAGRQRQRYVPLSQVATALEGIAQYQRLQTIVEEITRVNLELMKERSHEDT